jgi:hypothetical protein
MEDEMRVLLIEPEGDPRVHDVEGGWEGIRELLGCQLIQPLSLRDHDGVTMYTDEEAKLVNEERDGEWHEGRAPNDRATALVYGPDHQEAVLERAAAIAEHERNGVAVIIAGGRDRREPFVSGPVVVCGFDAAQGRDFDVPEWLVEQVTR